MIKTAFASLLQAIARLLVPFVAFHAGYSSGTNEKEAERLENENKILRKEIGRINSKPVTDGDVNKLLDDWEKHAKD